MLPPSAIRKKAAQFLLDMMQDLGITSEQAQQAANLDAFSIARITQATVIPQTVTLQKLTRYLEEEQRSRKNAQALRRKLALGSWSKVASG